MIENKTAFITGAAKRVGRAIAEDLAQSGWNIVIHYNQSHQEAEELAVKLQGFGVRVCLVKADLSNPQEVAGLMGAANAGLGTVQLLINNASVFDYDHIDTVSFENWTSHLIPNLWAPVKLIQDFAAQTEQGHVINIIDQRVWNLTPHYLSYTVSKAGLWTITQTLALALAPRIRVNAIGPGPLLQSVNQTTEQFAQQRLATPLHTGGHIQDICAAVHFFNKASSVTGQMVAIDGGQHLGWSMPPNPEARED